MLIALGNLSSSRSSRSSAACGTGASASAPTRLGKTASSAAWAAALDAGLAAIADFAPETLVVSLGVDTYRGDPISQFALTTPDYAILARDIAGLGVPTAIVMEGGYAIDALGANVASLLSGF